MTGESDAQRAAKLDRAARGGVCSGCRHARLVESARGSVFLRCAHPLPPKYPPQPVLCCAVREPA